MDLIPDVDTKMHSGGEATSVVDRLTPAQRSLHNNFLISVKTLKSGLVRTVYYLDRIRSHRVHRLLGYRTITEYAHAHAGLTVSQTKEFLFIARRLSEYPLVARALAEGSLSWGKAREICASIEPAQQQAWVDLARALPRQALRNAIREATAIRSDDVREPGHVGQSPQGATNAADVSADSRLESSGSTSPPADHGGLGPRPVLLRPGIVEPEPATQEKHHVTLVFDAEGMARWSSLLEHRLRRGVVSKEAAVLEGLAAPGIASPKGGEGSMEENSGPPYLVVILKQGAEDGGRIVTNRGESPVAPALLKAVACDSVIEDGDGRRRRSLPPRLRRLALQRARYRCQAQGCGSNSFLEVHHRQPHAGGGGDEEDNLVVLCWRCHRALHDCEEKARAAVIESPG